MIRHHASKIPFALCLSCILLVASTASAQFGSRGDSEDVVKTVGTTPGVCATENEVVVGPGTTVYYCYTSRVNTSNAVGYNLTDDILGPIESGILAPNSQLEVIVPATIFTNVTNVAELFLYLVNVTEGKNDTSFSNATVFVDPDLPGSGGYNPAIPTLSELALFSFGVLLIGGAFFVLRRTA